MFHVQKFVLGISALKIKFIDCFITQKNKLKEVTIMYSPLLVLGKVEILDELDLDFLLPTTELFLFLEDFLPKLKDTEMILY